MEYKIKKIAVETFFLISSNKGAKTAPIWPENYSISKISKPNIDEYLNIYNKIGKNWGWTAHNLLKREVLSVKISADTEHIYYLKFKDTIIGFFELQEHKNTIELLYFGLIDEYIGKGLGAKLIKQALFEASFFHYKEIELHTCEFDHKRALGTYKKAGFKLQNSKIIWEYYPIDFIKKHTIMTVNERLKKVRALMQKEHIDAYVITGTDPHLSEYVPDRWQIRKWISGFSGSAGRVVITKDFAGLWTDSRYFLQAEKELADSEFILMKLIVPHTPEYIDWLDENIKPFGAIGLDGKLISFNEATELYNRLSKNKIKVNFKLDFVSILWKDRPEFPLNKLTVLDTKFAGESVPSKINRLQSVLKNKKLDYFLISALDEIAWLLNIRANDVIYNPVAYAFAIISQEKIALYIKKEKLSPEISNYLKSFNVEIFEYNTIDDFIQTVSFGTRFGIDPDKTSKFFGEIIPNYTNLVLTASPVAELKAIKNETEIANTKKAMIKDGVALIKFFRWVEEIAKTEKETEFSLGQKLNKFRAEQENFVSDSFAPIVGFNENGAIVHYSANEKTAKKITKNGILLVDSGGQYFEGTTDITRTIALGDFPAEAKEDYTLVLKGHIQLAIAVFLHGTAGYQLDILARIPLWKAGKNYGHGTGHGVGYFLNVHEGPQSIRPRSAVHVAMEKGMITSNEPGYYPSGKYGIRIENLILTTEAKKNIDGEFLQFETLTLFPIERKLIKTEMLTKEELNWINNYQQYVYEQLSPFLNQEEKNWLQEQTKVLSKDK